MAMETDGIGHPVLVEASVKAILLKVLLEHPNNLKRWARRVWSILTTFVADGFTRAGGLRRGL